MPGAETGDAITFTKAEKTGVQPGSARAGGAVHPAVHMRHCPAHRGATECRAIATARLARVYDFDHPAPPVIGQFCAELNGTGGAGALTGETNALFPVYNPLAVTLLHRLDRIKQYMAVGIGTERQFQRELHTRLCFRQCRCLHRALQRTTQYRLARLLSAGSRGRRCHDRRGKSTRHCNERSPYQQHVVYSFHAHSVDGPAQSCTSPVPALRRCQRGQRLVATPGLTGWPGTGGESPGGRIALMPQAGHNAPENCPDPEICITHER